MPDSESSDRRRPSLERMVGGWERRSSQPAWLKKGEWASMGAATAPQNSNEGGERGGSVTEELEGDGVQGKSVLAPGREQLLDAEGGVFNLWIRKRRRIDFAP